MSKKTPMTKEAARRIQSQADKTGTNQEWKARAMSAAARNEAEKASKSGNGKGN